MRRTFAGWLVVLAVAVGPPPALGQSGGGYDLTWSTLDGGGGTSTGGDYELTGTIGQPEATAPAALSGAGIQLTSGFWVELGLTCAAFAPADFDHDCDVDAQDLAIFLLCTSAPTVAHSGTAECLAVDLDTDGDVDQVDYAVFQRCYTGSGLPANPACGG